jgi:hypothetical protein
VTVVQKRNFDRIQIGNIIALRLQKIFIYKLSKKSKRNYLTF